MKNHNNKGFPSPPNISLLSYDCMTSVLLGKLVLILNIKINECENKSYVFWWEIKKIYIYLQCKHCSTTTGFIKAYLEAAAHLDFHPSIF